MCFKELIKYTNFIPWNQQIIALNCISIKLNYLILSSIVIIIGIIGDHLLIIKRTLFNAYLIAFSDTLIHGLIAFFCWLSVFVAKGKPICEIILLLEAFICGLTASAIDLDHVIAARSFDIKTISQLQSRPFLHNTTLTLIISITIISLGLIRHNWMFHSYGWIFLTASLTHHLRDALRHGFWFYPLHTKAVPFWAYVLLLTIYPMICSIVMDIVTKEWLERHSHNLNIKYKTIYNNVEDV